MGNSTEQLAAPPEQLIGRDARLQRGGLKVAQTFALTPLQQKTHLLRSFVRFHGKHRRHKRERDQVGLAERVQENGVLDRW